MDQQSMNVLVMILFDIIITLQLLDINYVFYFDTITLPVYSALILQTISSLFLINQSDIVSTKRRVYYIIIIISHNHIKAPQRAP